MVRDCWYLIRGPFIPAQYITNVLGEFLHNWHIFFLRLCDNIFRKFLQIWHKYPRGLGSLVQIIVTSLNALVIINHILNLISQGISSNMAQPPTWNQRYIRVMSNTVPRKEKPKPHSVHKMDFKCHISIFLHSRFLIGRACSL